jgi:hypothetical protein
VLQVKERAPTPFPSVVFTFGLVVESIKEFRGASCTLVGWVDKVLEHALTKKNINNKFKVTIIWPFNPKVMDDKSRPSVIYTTEPNPDFSNDDTINFNNAIDEDQWGEDGFTTQLLNITIRKDVRTKLDG